MRLGTIISTIKLTDDKLNQIKKNMFSDNMIIINQTDKEIKEEYCLEDKIVIKNYNEKGLAKSRNRALYNNTYEFCLLTDDDVIYEKDIREKIIDAFDTNKDADIITFQYKKNHNIYGKKYKKKEFYHNRFSILKVSSIEIALRSEKINNLNIKYNELFGLGSKYIGGEEVIFLKDCLKKGLKIKYIPIPIAKHPDESSGKKIEKKIIFSRGAIFVELFNKFYWIFIVIFIIKKLKNYKGFGRINAMKLMFKGAKEYMKLKKLVIKVN